VFLSWLVRSAEPENRNSVHIDAQIHFALVIMTDLEIISIFLMILAIVVNLLVALIKEHNKNSHGNSLED